MSTGLAETALTPWHRANGARLVDFAGWSMPIQYGSILDEHHAVRRRVGMFDVSHMGRLRFDGADAAQFLDRLLTRRVTDLPLGGVRYSLVCNEAGGVLDDVLVYRLETPSGRQYHLLVVNASNREKIVGWINAHLTAGLDLEISDRTVDTAMIAVQGPRALDVAAPLFELSPAKLKYFRAAVTQTLGRPCTVSRTGYTGEDGFEVIVRADDAPAVWENIQRAGRQFEIAACGLGARDTLRLEAAMPLYGHELTEEIDPLAAGLAFAVDLEERDFLGRAALVERRQSLAAAPRRVGLTIDGRRPAREGYAVLADGVAVGRVTSGTLSPTLERPIAMAYVAAAALDAGQSLAVDIRGAPTAARVTPLPFYRRPPTA